MNDDELLTVRAAAAEIGLPPWTINRRVRARGIPTFRNPQDERQRAIRRADLGLLTAPRLDGRGRGEDRAA